MAESTPRPENPYLTVPDGYSSYERRCAKSDAAKWASGFKACEAWADERVAAARTEAEQVIADYADTLGPGLTDMLLAALRSSDPQPEADR